MKIKELAKKLGIEDISLVIPGVKKILDPSGNKRFHYDYDTDSLVEDKY